LEGLAELETEDPEVFAEAMAGLRERFGLRVLGGCCGTDGRHIRALAARLAG
jgi:homocysteine S-methyltransferase